MAGGGSIEDDMVETRGSLRIPHQPGELIECCNLHSAGAGELLLHAPYGGIGQDAAIGTDHLFAVGGGSLHRIDVGCQETGDTRHLGRIG